MDQALRNEIKYAVENSPFYKNHFSGYKIDGMSMNDFRNLPFTTKHDVSKNNQDFYCISRKEIKEFVTTSGTSGSPITIPLSKTDLERLAINESIALTKMGFDKSDTFQLLVTLDRQFMAGIAYYSGILRMGATVLRNGPGGLIGQLKSIEDFNPTVLIAVPSFILKLVDFSKINGFNLEHSSVKAIVCIGEPIHNSDFTLNNLAQSIVDKWKVRLCSTYASTEMATAFYQCKNNLGCHNNDDLIFTEVLNENGEQVASGEIGEIVVTTLGIQGMPLVRYRTGDITTYWSNQCGCGEDSIRIGPIIGRKDQMIKFRGTTLYPGNIFNALNSIHEIKIFFIEIVQKGVLTKSITIYLSIEDFDEKHIPKLKTTLNSLLRVTPSIILRSNRDIETLIQKHSSRKKTRIVFKQLQSVE